jgi:hypothetical protein
LNKFIGWATKPMDYGRSRNIVAKFDLFKERELVRKQWKALSCTPYFVNEQLPREVIAYTEDEGGA